MSETLDELVPAEDRAWADSTTMLSQLGTLIRCTRGDIRPGDALQAAYWAIAETFLQTCGKPSLTLPPHVSVGGQLFIDSEGRLCWYQHAGITSPPNAPSTHGNTAGVTNIIAEFIGNRYSGGFMLLNGDGFERWEATQWQDSIRDRSRVIFGEERTLIVPYEAITGARIEPQSIEPIHITPDTDDILFHDLGTPPGWNESFNRDSPILTNEWMDALWQANPQKAQAQPGVPERSHAMPTRRSRNGTMEFDHNRRRWRLQFERASGGSNYNGYWYVWQPLLDGEGQWGWQRARFTSPPIEGRPFCHWREDRHRLGASVFWANGFDGERHRFISAFDQHEPEPLYYLAQLPDEGKVESYEDAIYLLAPPIVHQAREQGRHVERQGDVFAIETNVKTREIYKRAKERVRRAVVLQPPQAVTFDTILLPSNEANLTWIEPKKGEVSETVRCPGCGNRHFKVGFGPKARRALTIFGTSHTATEVAVCEGGVTFIRGVMHHDPQLEEVGRRPEHVTRTLKEGKWYLAVRNTVPQQGTTRQEPSTDAQEEALVDQDAQVAAA